MTQTCLSEHQVGISKYINPNLPTFSAILKHRFTDFMVHEVNTSDQVIHLNDIGDPSKDRKIDPAPEPPKPKAQKLNVIVFNIRIPTDQITNGMCFARNGQKTLQKNSWKF